MKQFQHLVPVFATETGKPFVFWDSNLLRLMIFHGKRLTIVCYEPSDFARSPAFSKVELHASGKGEQLIYGSNGRPVASYYPELDVIVIKRDGKMTVFDPCLTPFGYASGELIDTPEETFPGIPIAS